MDLENLKKKRKVIRGTVTKIINNGTDSNNEDEAVHKIEQLRKYDAELDSLNEKILNLMIETKTEEECQRESDDSSIIGEKLLKAIHALKSPTNKVASKQVQVLDNNDIRLPKIALEVFELAPTNWLSFWTQFRRIDSSNMPLEDKFVYLRMSLTGAAKRLVEGYPNTAENYNKALDHLKRRFGRDDMIINCIYKDLLTYVKSDLGIVELYDHLSTKLRSLETLGLNKERAEILVPLIEECMPHDIRRIWERERGRAVEDNESDGDDENASIDTTNRRMGKIQQILDFLSKEAESEERLTMTSNSCSSRPTVAALVSSQPCGKRNSSYETKKTSCVFCGGSHASYSCTNELSVDERFKILSNNKACFKCMRTNHSRKNCRAFVKCRKCSKAHYDILCNKDNEASSAKQETAKPSQTMNMFAGPHGKITLQTLTCRVKNETVRALVDTASHRSYITKNLARKLGLEPKAKETMKHMLFGGTISTEICHNLYDVCLTSLDGRGTFKFQGLDQEVICGDIPPIDQYMVHKLFQEHQIVLANDGVDRPIDILLGADVLGNLMKSMKCIPNGIIAFETVLGWCLIGTSESNVNMANVALSLCNCVSTMWDLETLGIEKSEPATKQDLECIEHFRDNVSVEEGRYQVALPWRKDHPALPVDYEVAVTRGKHVLKRLEQSGLYQEYDEVFKTWETEGFIEQILDDVTEGHYLPHRPIVKEGKTTKIRPVFDASAKSSGTVSLNDCLHTGPNLLNQLLPLFLRFRMNEVGVTADIRQAFLMLGLKLESDKNMLKFLWWREGKLITYRHNRVVFGLSSSPFLLNVTITHHLTQFDSEIAKQLCKSFYVDDCVVSLKSKREAEEFRNEACTLMLMAKFDLRGWVFSGDEVDDVNVLGVKWSPKADVLSCCKPKLPVTELTKRYLLSLVGRVYDPLGILSAAMLYLKVILQECFRSKLAWDTPLPRQLSVRVERWLTEIDVIDSLRIPRCVKGQNSVNTQLHVFCDASKVGVGTCVYLRSENEQGVQVTLVAGKARVTPSESVTIPRLELIGATIAARLGTLVSNALEIPNVTYWTDSMISLYWIKGGEWRTWVGNRVKEIRSCTQADSWRFVPGELNMADIFSRGCLLSELVESQWDKGPSWLLENPSEWPWAEITPSADALAEQKTVNLINLKPVELDMFSHFSSFKKNVRVIDWIYRFLNNVRGRKTSGDLTVEEMEMAEIIMFKFIQEKWPPETDMDTEIDSNGIIRVCSKVRSVQFDDNFRKPILVRECALVNAMIMEEHLKMYHVGVSWLLNHLRKRVWIIKGRQVVRKVLNPCFHCRKFRKKPLTTPPVGLPDHRVNLGKVFQVCGCDLLGPLFLRDDSKVWIVIFTCAVYRAVHFEIVDSLSSTTFSLALRRFVSRRGKVSVMISDNGTNFKGLWNSLTALGIRLDFNWKFNPPTGSWWGGFFERLVGITKHCLKTYLGKARLTFDELSTVVVEIEAVMNRRPLTYVSADVEDPEAISPVMFLQQEELDTEMPELNAVDEVSLCQRVRYVNSIRKDLKNRFTYEYLGALAVRNKRFSDDVICVGSVVWISSDDKKRIDWELGRVVELMPGRDNVTRVVRLKTAKGEVLRPVQRLVLLEGLDSNIDNVNESDPIESNVEVMTDMGNDKSIVEEITVNELPSSSGVVTRGGRSVKVPTRLDL